MSDPIEAAKRTLENAAWKPNTKDWSSITEMMKRHDEIGTDAPLIAQALLDATAERDRLREALQEIASNCECCEDTGPCANCLRVAAALEEQL